MDALNKLALTVIVLSTALGVTPFLADNFLVKEQSFSFEANATAINATFNQTKSIGIVADSNMRFGKLPAGMGVSKFLNISMPKKGILGMSSSGNISEMLKYREYHYFQGREEINVKFNATRPGYFTGKVRLKTQLPKNRLGDIWLDIKYFFLRF